jgi:hypothetical protein
MASPARSEKAWPFFVTVILGSLAVHAVVLGSCAARSNLRVASTPPAVTVGVRRAAAEVGERAVRAQRIRLARILLVERARRARAAGVLELGDFLLETSRLDAEEMGRELDIIGARAAYRERTRALRGVLEKLDLRHAVAEVFGDLRYFGRPGGLVADALVERGGSCEPLAHLVAAALFDVGRGDQIELRFYGDVGGGVAHTTPVVRSASQAFDLMSGRPAVPGGAAIRPAELIEVYARARGLASPLAAPVRVGPVRNDDLVASSQPSIAAGYPPNGDRYPGALPLFSARAIREPSQDGDAEAALVRDARDHARDCAFQLRMAVLHPMTIALETDPTTIIEPTRVRLPSELERVAALLGAAEDLVAAADSDEADRLMAFACLKGLGQRAAIDFTLAGEHALSAEAERKARRAADLGRAAMAAADTAHGSRLTTRLSERYAGATWLLLVLDGGERVVTELVRSAEEGDWGKVNALAGLVVASHTRRSAFELLRGMPRRDQVDVMHEVFHAHDHLRPWASVFELDDETAADSRFDFPRAYRVFRGVAWRLWEGNRSIEETSAALAREAQAAGLDPEWEAVFFEYYGRNALGLHAQRAEGRGVVRALLGGVRSRRHAVLEPLRRRLEFLEAQPELDTQSIADAWRIR